MFSNFIIRFILIGFGLAGVLLGGAFTIYGAWSPNNRVITFLTFWLIVFGVINIVYAIKFSSSSLATIKGTMIFSALLVFVSFAIFMFLLKSNNIDAAIALFGIPIISEVILLALLFEKRKSTL